MAASGGVEGGDAHQTVHTGFALQEAVGVFALDHDVRGLQTGLVTVQIVQNLIGIAVRLRPAGVHPVEHIAPVLRLRAARAGMEGEKRVVCVVFARQERFQTRLFHVGLQLGVAVFQLVQHGVVVFLQRHLADGHQVVPGAAHALVLVPLMLQLLGAHHGFLRTRRVVPEAGCFRHGVQTFQLVQRGLRQECRAQVLQLGLEVVQLAFIFFKFNHGFFLRYSINSLSYSIAQAEESVKKNFYRALG